MYKFIKNNIFGFIIGVILTSSIGVFAISYLAGDISFIPKDSSWNVDNVNDALNSLYENSSNVEPYKVICGTNSRSSGVEEIIIEHDSDNAYFFTGQGSLAYSINSTDNYNNVTTALGSNYDGMGLYYSKFSVKNGDKVNIKRSSSGVYGYCLVY